MRTKTIKPNEQSRGWNIEWQGGIRACTLGTCPSMVTNENKKSIRLGGRRRGGCVDECVFKQTSHPPLDDIVFFCGFL